MSEKNLKRLRLISGAVVTAATLAVAALFIGEVLSIYLTGISAGGGEAIFTRDKVGQKLVIIAPFFFVWIALIIAAYVLSEIFPAKPEKSKNGAEYTLALLKRRMPVKSEELKSRFDEISREQTILRVIYGVCAALCLAAAIYTVVYLSIPSNFPAVEDKSVPIYNMVKAVFRLIGAAFLACCSAKIYAGYSAKKQIKTVKSILVASKGMPVAPDKVGGVRAKIQSVLKSKYFLWGVRGAVACLGVSFFIAGICNGGMHDMLIKAIKICTECIGLG